MKIQNKLLFLSIGIAVSVLLLRNVYSLDMIVAGIMTAALGYGISFQSTYDWVEGGMNPGTARIYRLDPTSQGSIGDNIGMVVKFIGLGMTIGVFLRIF